MELAEAIERLKAIEGALSGAPFVEFHAFERTGRGQAPPLQSGFVRRSKATDACCHSAQKDQRRPSRRLSNSTFGLAVTVAWRLQAASSDRPGCKSKPSPAPRS